MKTKLVGCSACDKTALTKDEMGICRKLLGNQLQQYYCLSCLAEYLDCTPEDILAKIKQFKAEGCKLFS